VKESFVTQSHDFVGDRESIQFHEHDTSGIVIGILDCDAINGTPKTVSQTEARPIFRYDRVDRESVAAAFESENFFEPDPIGPCGRSGVPSPATTPDVAGLRSPFFRQNLITSDYGIYCSNIDVIVQ
jgi:hypothetical protein